LTQAIAKKAVKDRGDVYLDRNDLSELRAAGNEFRIREERNYQQRTGSAGRQEETKESERTFEADRLTDSQQQSQEPE